MIIKIKDCTVHYSLESSAPEMYDIIRTLYLRVKSAKHVPDKVHALTAFLEHAETLLERHGEFK